MFQYVFFEQRQPKGVDFNAAGHVTVGNSPQAHTLRMLSLLKLAWQLITHLLMPFLPS